MLAVFQAEPLMESLKFLVGMCAGSEETPKELTCAFPDDIHEDGKQWKTQMKNWLAKWSHQRLVAKLGSCKAFVSLVFQKDLDTDKIGLESVTGPLDPDEEIQAVSSACRVRSCCLYSRIRRFSDRGI